MGYVHSVMFALGILQSIMAIYPQTSINWITFADNHNHKNQYVKLMLIFAIPYHLQLFLTNFILFIWLKIYYAVGVTDGWLNKLKRIMIIASIISFIILTGVTICTMFLSQSITKMIFIVGMCLMRQSLVVFFCLSVFDCSR